MSERAISDPSQHGWVEVDGKWMWGGSGGGSGNGSIQDGDTEGQITTWDGTEWTPEGAVVVGTDGAVVFKKSDGTTIVTFDKDGDAYFAGGLGKFSGDVQVDGRLFINGDEVTAGGGDVDAYTKAESDGKYVPKSGNTTISGTLTATDFVTS